MDKRKLAGALSLGAVAAGTGSTAAGWCSNPFKKVSEKIKALTKSVDHDLNKNHDESKKNEKGYGAAINIAYRIYNILGEQDKKLLIDKLKELCINYHKENEVISKFRKKINEREELTKKIEEFDKENNDENEIKENDNKKIENVENSKIKEREKRKSKINLDACNTSLNEDKDLFIRSLSSYSNLLLKMAKDTGIEDVEIDECFTCNISGYQRSSNECNVMSIKMRNNAVIDDIQHKVYDFYIYKFNEGLSFSKESEGNILKQIYYSSNYEFHNEEAVLKAIENLEKKVFNLDNDKDGKKALKLIVSLIINKYEAESKEGETGGHKDILKKILELEINGDDGKSVKGTKFKKSEYASSFSEKELDSEKIDLLKELANNNSGGLKNILKAATNNMEANIVFSAQTKKWFTRIADNKITRLSVTGAGAYFGGMVLAPALGLGLVGTTLLATGTASAANAVTDYVSDKTARSANAWSISGIGSRYKSPIKRIPMTLTAYSAKTIFGTVKRLTSLLK